MAAFSSTEYEDCSEGDSESGSDSDSDEITYSKGDFFGCYLLVSQSQEKKYKGKTYIGFTVDPNRRLKQHNGGHLKGGARKTSGKGPWAMVLIVHGFPNHIAALRFEWAWQNPGRSRRLGKDFAKKNRKESHMEYRFRVLTEMLSVGPWNRLPLTVRTPRVVVALEELPAFLPTILTGTLGWSQYSVWLRPEFELQFPAEKKPPDHMPTAYGPVDLAKPSRPPPSQGGHASQAATGEVVGVDIAGSRCEDCRICHGKAVDKHLVSCYHKSCTYSAHLTCLGAKMTAGGRAKGSRDGGHLIPVREPCPDCGRALFWGELVRRCRARKW